MRAQLSQPKVTPWRSWVQRPQGLWIRKAFFQIHLWAGLAIGIYVVVISVSGSALVYRREITRRFSRKAVAVTPSARRMSIEELALRAQQAYPAYEVDNIREGETPGEPDDVVLERAHKRIERWFDPYTGSDLGNPYSAVDGLFEWLADLHDDLLGGRTGRQLNGIGACLLTLLSLTGAILWWPGARNWRRSATISWKARFPRFNWDVHSAIGFWCWLFVLVWGISGIYFCFPILFGPRIHLVAGSFLSLITQLHIGRFGAFAEALWTVLGLAPALSAVTGALMWWNRVLRKTLRRHRQAEPAAAFRSP